MTKPFWGCENDDCGCNIPGVAIYRCNNCGSIRCGKCCSEGKDCSCTYEDDDNTYSGTYHFAGHVCTQAEWDEWKEYRAGVQRQLEIQRKEELERRKLYEKKLKGMKRWFRATLADGAVLVGEIVESSVVCQGWSFSPASFEGVKKIDLSNPCRCQRNCSQRYGRGEMVLDDGGTYSLYKYWKREFIFFRQQYTSYSGTITMLLNSGKRNWFDIDHLITLSTYVPSIDEVLGKP